MILITLTANKVLFPHQWPSYRKHRSVQIQICLSWELEFFSLGLAQWGLTSACSLWHDMSWASACALCFVCSELPVFVGQKQVAAPSGLHCDSEPNTVKKVSFPYGPLGSRVLIFAMLDGVQVEENEAFWFWWHGSEWAVGGVKGCFVHFQRRSMQRNHQAEGWGHTHARRETKEPSKPRVFAQT